MNQRYTVYLHLAFDTVVAAIPYYVEMLPYNMANIAATTQQTGSIRFSLQSPGGTDLGYILIRAWTDMRTPVTWNDPPQPKRRALSEEEKVQLHALENLDPETSLRLAEQDKAERDKEFFESRPETLRTEIDA